MANERPQRRSRALLLGLGGLAVAGAGAFTYFAWTGHDREERLATECAPHCDADEVAGVRTRYLVADIGLAVSLAAVTTGLVLHLTGRSPGRTTVARLLGTPSGAAVGGSF